MMFEEVTNTLEPDDQRSCPVISVIFRSETEFKELFQNVITLHLKVGLSFTRKQALMSSMDKCKWVDFSC